MSAIALVGGLTYFIREEVWRKMILPLVAFAAGALIGGAFFHMIPAAVEKMGNSTALYCWLAGGYMLFYVLEEFLHWHHSHTHAHHDHGRHHHHHHNECSHHNHVFHDHRESHLPVYCSHNCYSAQEPTLKEEDACCPPPPSSGENAKNSKKTHNVAVDASTKTVIEGVTVLVDNEKEQPENISHGNASTTASLHNTSSCTDINSGMYYDPDHHDLEEGNCILQNCHEQSKHQRQEKGSEQLMVPPAAMLQNDNPTNHNNSNLQHQHLPSQHDPLHDDVLHQMTPVIAYLIIIADAVHNFLGGLFVGASFVDSTSLGISAWVAAAAHEIPQELGDFAVLSHGGWSKQKALLFNFLSALTFPLGGVIAFAASKHIEVSFLVPFAAGNFLYIGGSDLIPEVKHSHGTRQNFIHFVSCSVGVGLMLLIRILLHGW